MSRISSAPAFVFVLVSLLTGTSTHADPADQINNVAELPRYLTPFPYSGIRGWHITQNLGPTGARGWVKGLRGDSLDSREILIKSVEPGSPAQGILRPYDVILGAAVPPDTPSTRWTEAPLVERFTSDARLSMARAITWAESIAGGGELQLLRSRDGEVETVTIKLPVMGDYSPTAPANCKKTDRIVTQAADFLAAEMPPEGFFNLDGAMNAMLLLAHDDDRYLDHVRRTAYRMAVNRTINTAGHETWRWGYSNVFLTEYYLATGDKTVLPQITAYANGLADGQCNPGTWGHSTVPDFIPPGYGSLNSSGVVCFISLVLSSQIGVDYDEQALVRSTKFFGSYAGTGSIPYGDHPPGNAATDNGKNGMGAVAFHLLGAEPAAQWFARLCASTNLKGFEGGHTGNLFNQVWAPLGASLAGEENYAAFWSRFNPYRDLARRYDGAFVTQPWTHGREGCLGTGNYVKRGPFWATGGYALSYLAGTERLAVLGRRDSVFAKNAPAALKPALEAYHAKDFRAARTAALAITDADDPRVSRMAKQLGDAAQRNLNSIEFTLDDMNANLAAGDLVTLKAQLQAIASVVAEDDPRLTEFREALDDSANAPLLADAVALHKATAARRWYGPQGYCYFARPYESDRRARATLERFAGDDEHPFAERAQELLDDSSLSDFVLYTPLVANDPKSDEKPWRMGPARQTSNKNTPADVWPTTTFDDSDWTAVALPGIETLGRSVTPLRRTFQIDDPMRVRDLMLDIASPNGLDVYLNGTLILSTGPGRWTERVRVPLKRTTTELLRKGDNVLAVGIKGAAKSPTFNVSLLALERNAK